MTTTRTEMRNLLTTTNTDTLLGATKKLLAAGDLSAAEKDALARTVAELVKRGVLAL